MTRVGFLLVQGQGFSSFEGLEGEHDFLYFSWVHLFAWSCVQLHGAPSIEELCLLAVRLPLEGPHP